MADDKVPDEPAWMRSWGGATQAPGDGRPQNHLRAVKAGEPEAPAVFATRVGTDIPMKAPTFAWAGRIQVGELTLIDGEPMEGKTTLMLGLAARMTRGYPMPFDPAPRDARSVLFFGPEEDISQAAMPRFVAAGGDPARFFEMDTNWADARAMLSFPSGAQKFDDTLTGLAAHGHPIGMALVDGMSALIDRKLNENRYSDVMEALGAMLRVLRKHQVALIGLRHLGKMVHDDIADRGIGSKAFRGMARCQIVALPHPEEPGKKVLLWTKHTGSKEEPKPVVYELQSAQVVLTDGTVGSFGVAEFLDELPIKAREVAEQVSKRKRGTASTSEVKQAIDFLRTELADGVMRPYFDLVNAARKQFKLPQDAVFRAKERLRRDGVLKSEPDREWTGDLAKRPWLVWIPIIGQAPTRAPAQVQLPLPGGEGKS